MRNFVRGALASGVLLVGVVGQAQAATIGSDLAATANVGYSSCMSDCTLVQRVPPPGRQVTAPSDGVIVRWRIKVGSTFQTSPVKLRVVRGTGAASTGVGSSSPESVPATPGIYAFDTRLPIKTGEYIGIDCCVGTAAGIFLAGGGPTAVTDYWGQRLEDGETRAPLIPIGNEVLVNADVEPDADNDGFGDETQDQCSTDATTQGPCPAVMALPDTDPPETTITKDPASKTDKSRVKYSFVSDEAGSTFECSLKGKGLDAAVKQFNVCPSPRTYKRLDPRKFKFEVRAIDAAGNVDPTADRDKFKVLATRQDGKAMKAR